MKKKKWKDIRSALVMVLVMVAMLGTATYAWFSLSNSPTVTGLQMTATTSGGLKICETSNGTFVNAIDISASTSQSGVKTLSPVSVVDGEVAKFYKPVYSGNTVTGLESSELSNLDGYVAKYTYYLKSEEAGIVNVGIITADPSKLSGNMGVDSNNQSNLVGSFVRGTTGSTGTATQEAIYAVRIGFVVDGKMYIYEPNNESEVNTGSKAVNTVYEPTSTVISGTDGGITRGYYSTSGDTTSKALFEVTTAGTEVTMYIWIEGTDDDCVDQIQTDQIEAQIQFTVVE